MSATIPDPLMRTTRTTSGPLLLALVALAGCTIAPPLPPQDAGTGSTAGLDAAAVPLRVTVFVDYGCAPCGEAVRTLREIAPAYQGRVLVTVRDFITPQVNPGAYRAAIGARCAQEQGRGDDYAAMVFASQVDWKTYTDGLLTTWALQARLEPTAFQACVQQLRPASAIADDLRDGKLLGVTRTPAIFLGSVPAEDPGSVDGWRALIDSTLKGAVRRPSLPPPAVTAAPS